MTSNRTPPLLCYYGDDFTGSTDAMEVTALAGLRTVLFTHVPNAEALSRFNDYAVVGIAGTSRAQSPEWMESNLPHAFKTLVELGPKVIHYKVCSTFDSAPEIGSIGRAIDIGTRIVGGQWSPLIVGTPQLGRWQVFGNLFAAAGGSPYRIDRHPTMSRHPVTPMQESDLRRHLGQQTSRPICAINWTELEDFSVSNLPDECPAVFLDVLDARTQLLAGQIVWEMSGDQIFSASSSGLQYALVAHWRNLGLIPQDPPKLPDAKIVPNMLVLSGSCSPVTAEQINFAEANGFATIRLDVVAGTSKDRADQEFDRIIHEIGTHFDQGAPVLVYAARSVDDPAYAALRDASAAQGIAFAQAQDKLGRFLGRVALDAVPRFNLKRLVAAGGDTSGRIIEALPIDALEVAHPLVKGAPICRCYSMDPAYDGLQVMLKGGQIGGREVFVQALGKME